MSSGSICLKKSQCRSKPSPTTTSNFSISRSLRWREWSRSVRWTSNWIVTNHLGGCSTLRLRSKKGSSPAQIPATMGGSEKCRQGSYRQSSSPIKNLRWATRRCKGSRSGWKRCSNSTSNWRRLRWICQIARALIASLKRNESMWRRLSSMKSIAMKIPSSTSCLCMTLCFREGLPS